MNQILYISCSPKGPASICRTFAQEVLTHLTQRHPGAAIIHRDLAATPPPLVDADFCTAIMDPAGSHNAFAASEQLIEELERANAVVIATPMHNYAVPAVLKAWIDQIVRIHRSFVSTPSGKLPQLPPHVPPPPPFQDPQSSRRQNTGKQRAPRNDSSPTC